MVNCFMNLPKTKNNNNKNNKNSIIQLQDDVRPATSLVGDLL